MEDRIASGMLIFEYELNCFKGKLLLSRSGLQNAHAETKSEAESCFRHAIEIARGQEAKSFELPAVMELSRLWMEQGKKEEARNVFAEIYSWFTEGFDTGDLIEARELLDQLNK